MDNPAGILEQLGIDLKIAFAGLAGSTVYIFAFKKSERMQIIGSLVVGTLTAIYVAPYAAFHAGTPPALTGFILGFGGMVFAKTGMSAIKRWNPTIPGVSSGG